MWVFYNLDSWFCLPWLLILFCLVLLWQINNCIQYSPMWHPYFCVWGYCFCWQRIFCSFFVLFMASPVLTSQFHFCMSVTMFPSICPGSGIVSRYGVLFWGGVSSFSCNMMCGYGCEYGHVTIPLILLCCFLVHCHCVIAIWCCLCIFVCTDGSVAVRV